MNQNQNEDNSEKVEKKHNIVYRITNQINWKYYFGIHSTDNLEDGYFGGGTALKRAIKKYGKENFHRCIIENYPTRKEASDHERLIVTMYQVNNEQCYNIKTGGDNEFTFVVSDETREKMSIAQSGDKHPNYGKQLSEETRKKISESNTGKTLTDETKRKLSEAMSGENHPLFGKNHTDKSRKQMSESRIGRFTGEDNPTFGKPRSDETRTKISKTLTGKTASPETILKMKANSPTKKSCNILGIIYSSGKEASRALGVPKSTVYLRLHSKNILFKDWNFV